jgi:cytochrome c biogenesis protein CcdA
MRLKKFFLGTGLFLLLIFSLYWLKSNIGAAGFIWRISGQGARLFPLVSISALLDSINPCAFSVLLLTIAFLFSLASTRTSILKIGGTYIFGIFVAYFALGLGILQALHLFNTPHFMAKIGALLLISLGILNLTSALFPAFPLKFKLPAALHEKMAGLMQKSSLLAAFFLGALVGLCEMGCTGGPYLMVLGLLHDSQTYSRGLAYLAWYNLLFVAPLVAALTLASDREMLEKLKLWRGKNLKKFGLWSAIIMIALGILTLYF